MPWRQSEVFAINWVVMNWTKYCCPALKMKDISSLMVKLVMHIATVKLTNISARKQALIEKLTVYFE